ncbi:recombination repair protein 1 isoform X2 [Scaptodrosophila lebanonensis]|uniref:DNA-(apurinic or apyrimidinic site) endonuclease n=1 Tax=Drosophila lebanonensis TaxID=7225 RepID=A0A6J2TP54_DROLE|nr:recombination repair protein 1 isoform X2 [Scaptodrosophila lebanonensis]
MPRAKASKKQPASESQSLIDAGSADAETKMPMPAKNGKARAKKTPTVATVEPLSTKDRSKKEKTPAVVAEEEVENAATVKEPKSRGRKKKEVPVAVVHANGDGAGDEDGSEGNEVLVKPVKRRGKNVTAASTSKSAKSAKSVPELVAAAAEPRGRGSKRSAEKEVAGDTVEANGVAEAVEPVKQRAKKEPKTKKSEKKVAEGTVETNGVAEATEPVKQRAKKEPKTKKAEPLGETIKARGRVGKRLADSDITDVLEEEPESETEPEPTKKRAKSSKEKSSAEPAAAKKRTKKTASNEEPQEAPEGAEAAQAAPKKRGKKVTSAKESVEQENKPARGRKRAAVEPDQNLANGNEDDGEAADTSKTSKAKKETAPAANSYNEAHFAVPEGKEFNLKISSWNVAGLRAWLKKDGLKFLEYEEPDIFCMQETKCANDQLPEEVVRLPGYHPYWLCMPGGYAGVAIYSKIMPIHVEYGIGNEEFDDVGRMITAEYEKFYLLNVYVPNSGRKLVNLEPRMRWEKLFQDYVQKLDALKPVVICGDMNVSHLEIDLANPKSNTRNAGFTKEERDKMTELLGFGYVDTFRHLYPKRTGAYTFWTYMANARARNVGWRLDYCIVSERFLPRVVDNCIRSQCMGSDHCPITVFLNI